jgi:hypothetical protein
LNVIMLNFVMVLVMEPHLPLISVFVDLQVFTT